MVGKEIVDLDEALKRVDYRHWFSDVMAKDNMANLERRYNEATNESEKKAILDETALCMQNYTMLVYYIYPNFVDFRKAVDADPELKRNFNMVKNWLDARGAKKFADEYAKEILVSAITAAGDVL